MEKLCFAYRRQIAHTGIACVFALSAPLFISHVGAQESVVQKELNRRINNARKAQELLKSGDSAYQNGKYAAAVKDYSEAFNLLPPGSMSHQIRQAASQRYATAATEHARQLGRVGDYDKARSLLKTVLSPEIAPAHAGALKMLARMDNPHRFNPALTPAHTQNIHKVGRLLREAEGFYSLGQHDRAAVVYMEVLRIDRYNKAARRGLEKIETAKSDYYRAARDHAASEMLAEVDKSWELRPKIPHSRIPTGPALTGDRETLAPDIREKLAGITVASVNLDNATLEEAVDFIRIQSRLGDIPDAGGEQSGTNIIVNLGDPNNDRVKRIRASRVSLKARGLPLSKVLDYVTDQTKTQWRTDGMSVIITPRGSTDETMVTRKFRVPPNFLASAAVKKAAQDDNPFGDDDDDAEGKIAKKIGIKEFLMQNGVSFPKGATASYASASNVLLVKNTASNIDIIDQLVTLIANEEPVMVIVKTTILRVSEEKLKELSFDWVLTPWAFGRQGLTVAGGGVGNGTPLGALPDSPLTSPPASPVTSGLRSGNAAVIPDSIDDLINIASTGRGYNPDARAPGIFTVTGVFSSVQVQMMMRGLDNTKGVDIMVKPSTITRSGQRATFELIQEFIYPSEYEPPELPNSTGITFNEDGELVVDGGAIFPVTPATPTAFETRSAGLTLEVEPTVGPNKKYIELSLQPEVVELQGFINYGSPIQTPIADAGGNLIRRSITDNRIVMPIFKTLRLKNSTLTIQDGATVVLGGLIQSNKSKVEDKVPILGDIPLAGRLFRSEAERNFREAVIFMVSAELVDPTGQPWRNR